MRTLSCGRSLTSNKISDQGATAIAEALKVNGALTECNVRGNDFHKESAGALAKVATEKRVMLFGIKHDQTSADFSGGRLNDIDAILIASDLRVSGALTKLWIAENQIGDQGASAIAEGLKVNGALTTLGLDRNQIGDDGAKALASSLEVNGALTTLIVSANEIGDDGAKALASSLEVNGALTELK